MDMSLWNTVLTIALTLISWFAKTLWDNQQQLQKLLNKTREEVAREYVTKAELHTDINRVVQRLDTMDSKIDRLIERMNQ